MSIIHTSLLYILYLFYTFPYILGYTQTSHYSQNFVVVNQPGMMRCQSFLETPVRTTCPSCRAEILTSTHYETGTFTWVACLVIAFVGYVLIILYNLTKEDAICSLSLFFNLLGTMSYTNELIL